MKENIKIIIAIITLLGAIWLIVIGINIYRTSKLVDATNINNMFSNKKAQIVRVNEKSLDVLGFDGEYDLYSVSYAKEGNIGFKQGQEILINFSGGIAETFPAQINNVSKIKITKEKSEKEIPVEVLRFYYSNLDNVRVSINELTNSGITLTITDKNDLPYEYSYNYTIYKKVKNKEYTGIGYKIGEDTENSTSGYTRNRKRVHLGRNRKNFKYIM